MASAVFSIIPYCAECNQVSSLMFLYTSVQKRKTVCIHTAAKKMKENTPWNFFRECSLIMMVLPSWAQQNAASGKVFCCRKRCKYRLFYSSGFMVGNTLWIAEKQNTDIVSCVYCIFRSQHLVFSVFRFSPCFMYSVAAQQPIFWYRFWYALIQAQSFLAGLQYLHVYAFWSSPCKCPSSYQCY